MFELIIKDIMEVAGYLPIGEKEVQQCFWNCM